MSLNPYGASAAPVSAEARPDPSRVAAGALALGFPALLLEFPMLLFTARNTLAFDVAVIALLAMAPIGFILACIAFSRDRRRFSTRLAMLVTGSALVLPVVLLIRDIQTLIS